MTWRERLARWINPQPENTYSCYYVTIHFADAEAATEWITQNLTQTTTVWAEGVRLQRGGERLRWCQA